MVKLSLLKTVVLALVPAALASRRFEYKTLDYDYDFDENTELPRSIIMMIPDGTGPNIYTLARTVLDPTNKLRLHIDPLHMGTVQTHSSTSYITDSASSATAYATGFKTYDTGIGVDHFQQPIGTILEAAKARGMLTGMIVTSRVTHATPASFATHVLNRNSEDEIARQYVSNKNLDFLLGGGARHFNESMLTELRGAGYAIVRNYGELLSYKAANEAAGNLRVFGLFANSHMSYEVDRVRELQNNPGQQGDNQREPSLSEMVDAILPLVRNNPAAKKHGFFVMIEGSRVDHAGHNNDPGTMAKEAIEFDATVGIVKDFVLNSQNVAMLSVADHGTGGLTLGADGIYDWDPVALQKQVMSTEVMSTQLGAILKDCGASDNATCKAKMLDLSKELITKNTNVTTLLPNQTTELEAEIAKAVDKTRDLKYVMTELGHIISKPALIGWTTVGHVGMDVDLHCLGPSVFERLCKGVHDNTYINKMMANYLNLAHAQDIETMRLRNQSTLEYSEPVEK